MPSAVTSGPISTTSGRGACACGSAMRPAGGGPDGGRDTLGADARERGSRARRPGYAQLERVQSRVPEQRPVLAALDPLGQREVAVRRLQRAVDGALLECVD